MKLEKLVQKFEDLFRKEKADECEELHNALVDVITEQNASIQNVLFVLDIIKFEFMEAKYKEIMGVVKLTDKPPIKKITKEK